MKQRVQMECICVEPPAGNDLWIGLQEGRSVVQDVRADFSEQTFRFTLDVQPGANGQPNFTGAYAQGTPADRFVYLCWGQRVGGVWVGVRRAKIRLGELSWETIRAAIDADQPIRARISLTDAKGQPITASLKPGQMEWEAMGERQ